MGQKSACAVMLKGVACSIEPTEKLADSTNGGKDRAQILEYDPNEYCSMSAGGAYTVF